MVTCPKCTASLPDWAQNCQFCGSDVRAVQRTADQAPTRKFTSAAFEVPKWVWIAYYFICGYFVLSGLVGILTGLLGQTQNVVSVIGGTISLILGVGLAFRVELIRGIVNFVCGINIIFGLIGLAGTILSIALLGPLGVLLLIFRVFDLVTNGMMIYLIGETEKGMPNI